MAILVILPLSLAIELVTEFRLVSVYYSTEWDDDGQLTGMSSGLNERLCEAPGPPRGKFSVTGRLATTCFSSGG